MGSRRSRLKLVLEFRDKSVLPWQEQQADMMLVTKMATEFQGFARHLHDNAIDFLATSAASRDPRLANVIQLGLSRDRALDKNNAGSDTLTRDFSRIGLIFWPAILVQEPQFGPGWQADLAKLIEMRNAIAHDNKAKLLQLATGGFALTRNLTRRWHQSLDLLAASMDDVVASYLGALLGVPRPW
jgi:hypothetical protein